MRKYADSIIILYAEVILLGGKTSARSKNTWIEKTYDRINLTVPKGKKDTIKAHAESHGQSVNSFINEAIDEKMERDQHGD